MSYPLPGTIFYERVKKELKEKTNWTDSDELDLLFRNTYAPAFYKQLHRYVHKTYRKHLAIQQFQKLWAKPRSLHSVTIKKSLSFFYYAPASWLDKKKLNSLEKLAI